MAALARVFDAQSPALLRFGVHLVGDASAAEDLVQETFLTALERAEQYDAERPIERWLAGILVRHAQELRREARRFASRDLHEIVDAQTPFDAAARQELSGELARAVDALEEPYRAAILLHLRHGLGAADIAHVLDRSPGAVRVQLHRAREMLRKSLPAGMAGALFVLAVPSRGLEAVRAHVLAHATGLAPGAMVGAGLVGGGLVVKKLVVAVVILLAGIAALLVMRRDPATPDAPRVVANKPLKLSEPAVEVPIATPGSAAIDERRAGAPGADPAAVTEQRETLRGLVLDAETDQPVAGAKIALYAPIGMRFSALRARYWDRVDDNDWRLKSALPWPWFERELTPAMLADLEDIPVRAAPENGAPPIATAVSNVEGRFVLSAESTDGLLTCDAVGYAQRTLVTRDRGYGVDPKSDHTIYVSKAGRMRGAIVDNSGAPVRDSIALSFYAHAPKGLRSSSTPARDEQDRRITIRTDGDGRFDVATDAHLGFVNSLDPRWYVVRYSRPEDPSARKPGIWIDLLDEKGAVEIVLASQLSLLVRDAATQAPIEDAFVSVRMTSTLASAKHGWFHLKEGRLQLTPEFAKPPFNRDAALYHSESVCSVWVPGYARESTRIPDLLAPGIVEIDLVRAVTPPIAGQVRRGPVGVAGARVLASEALYGLQDQGDDAIPHVGVVTDAEGKFELSLPDGRFVIVVEHKGTRVVRALHVPGASSIDVDLDASATLLVHMVDIDGKPAVSHDVRIRDAQAIVSRGTTDGRGIARFEGLPAGPLEVGVCYAPSGSGYRADDERTTEMLPGATTQVEFTTPGAKPKFARLVVEDGTVDGWTSRRDAWSGGGGGDIRADGRVPIDFSEERTFVLVAPNGAQHWVTMPEGAPDGAEVRLRTGDRGYRGEIREEVTETPLKNLVLIFESKGTPSSIVHVDAEGRFEVRGLADASWSVRVVDQTGGSDRLPCKVTFDLELPPADPPTHLVLRRPRFVGGTFEGRETVMLDGRLEKESAAAIGALAYLSVKLAGDGYATWLSHEARVGADGHFRMRVPASGERVFGLWGSNPFRKLATDKWQPTGTDPEVRDIALLP